MLSNHWLPINPKYHTKPKGIIISISFIIILNSFIKRQSILYQKELKLFMEIDNSNTNSHVKFHNFWTFTES